MEEDVMKFIVVFNQDNSEPRYLDKNGQATYSMDNVFTTENSDFAEYVSNYQHMNHRAFIKNGGSIDVMRRYTRYDILEW